MGTLRVHPIPFLSSVLQRVREPIQIKIIPGFCSGAFAFSDRGRNRGVQVVPIHGNKLGEHLCAAEPLDSTLLRPFLAEHVIHTIEDVNGLACQAGVLRGIDNLEILEELLQRIGATDTLKQLRYMRSYTGDESGALRGQRYQ